MNNQYDKDISSFSENQVCLVEVDKLISNNSKFIIPTYQRGYRWGKSQIKKFIEDIDKEDDGYCIQTLTVKKFEEENEYEVIDGQQRLTTIFILLSVLSCLQGDNIISKCYLDYESRKASKDFIVFLSKLGNEITSEIQKELKENKKNKYFLVWKNIVWKEFIDKNSNHVKENIDFRYIAECYIICFEDLMDRDKKSRNILLNKVLNSQFIWIPQNNLGLDSRASFISINMGKVELTDSELIKAELLNYNNFNQNKVSNLELSEIKSRQKLIAEKWYYMEGELNEVEFWASIPHREQYSRMFSNRTRIDILFEYFITELYQRKSENNKLLNYIKNSEIALDYNLFNEIIGVLLEKYDRENLVTHELLWGEVNDIFAKLKEVCIGKVQKQFNKQNDSEEKIELTNFVGLILDVSDNKYIEVYKKISKIMLVNRTERLEVIKEILAKELGVRDRKEIKIIDFVRSLRYPNKKLRKIILLYNIILLSKSKGIGSRYNFLLHREQEWTIDHIFPQKFITTNEIKDVNGIKEEKKSLNQNDLIEVESILKLLIYNLEEKTLSLKDNYMFNYINYLYGQKKDELIEELSNKIIERNSGLNGESIKEINIEDELITNFIKDYKEKFGESKYKYQYDYARCLQLIRKALIILKRIEIIKIDEANFIATSNISLLINFEEQNEFFESKMIKTKLCLMIEEDDIVNIENENIESKFIDLNDDSKSKLSALKKKYNELGNFNMLESEKESIKSNYKDMIKDIYIEYYNNAVDCKLDIKMEKDFKSKLISIFKEVAMEEITDFFVKNNNKFESFNELILDESIGNLALLDKLTNGCEEFGNNPYSEKKIVIYKKMKQNSFIPLSTLLAFTNIYTKDPQSNKYWIFESRYYYLKDVLDTVGEFLRET